MTMKSGTFESFGTYHALNNVSLTSPTAS